MRADVPADVLLRADPTLTPCGSMTCHVTSDSVTSRSQSVGGCDGGGGDDRLLCVCPRGFRLGFEDAGDGDRQFTCVGE